MQRRVYMGMGVRVLEPGRPMVWGVSPIGRQFSAERMLIRAEGVDPFWIAVHRLRVGEGQWVELPRYVFTRGNYRSLPIFPGPIRLEPGEELFFLVKNIGPRAATAVAGLFGVADDVGRRPTLH